MNSYDVSSHPIKLNYQHDKCPVTMNRLVFGSQIKSDSKHKWLKEFLLIINFTVEKS